MQIKAVVNANPSDENIIEKKAGFKIETKCAAVIPVHFPSIDTVTILEINMREIGR